MYPLGEQFKLNVNTNTDPKYVFKGNKYRISVLSERLIRLEYSENGEFEDLPTEFAWNRNFSEPEFNVNQDSNYLEITTPYFKLTYLKEKNFKGGKLTPASNLKVQVLNSDKVWYYGHPEVRNFKAPANGLSKDNEKTNFMKSLYSLDGFVSFDDSDTKVFELDGTVSDRKTKEIDIYLFVYLKDFLNCLKDYFYLTGYPSLIPRYALGNWWSRDMAYNDASLKNLLDQFKRNNIPLSILLLDNKWHVLKENSESGFTFNKRLFKAPYEMISYIHNQGIRIGLSVNPTDGFYSIDDYYEKVKTYLTPDENGEIPFNVLDPKWIDVYLKFYIHPLDTLDVDFYWIKNSDKTTLEEINLLKHYHFYDMMRENGHRPLVLAKNSLIAAHRYPVLYSGKIKVGWDTLSIVPFHNLNATNIGVSWWAHDIGGSYKGIEDEELYTRFVQLGVFSPIMKFGSDNGKYYKREPWRWGVKTYTIVKDYLTLRHQLIPYLYTEAYKYHKFGNPLLIPLYYKYPDYYDDERYRNEYYFGSELFVSPIIKKKDYIMNRAIHKMFIPEGTWYDFVTGKKFPGGREYVGFFKDQDYPVFAKAGAIIPLGIDENLNNTNPPKDVEIHVFPGRSNSYMLYEDDGTTNLYLNGHYLTTEMEYNYSPNEYKFTIKSAEGKTGIVPEIRNYKIKFRNTKEAKNISVLYNNSPIKFMTYVDGNDFIIDIKEVKSIGELRIICSGDNIEIDATRIINEDIEGIISDLHIETEMKEKIDSILFSDLTIKKKRIEIRKLSNQKLESKFIQLFLKLLEYIGQV